MSTPRLLDLLASDLLAWLRQRPDGAPRRVLLWLDPSVSLAASSHISHWR
jgi:hypothetical protein